MLHSRIKRIEEEYKQALAEILNYEIDDPRIEFASVSYVHVSKDLGNAVVGISLLQDDPEQAQDCMDAIASAKGYIKRLLADRKSVV
jgi:ribosome-binding factor A